MATAIDFMETSALCFDIILRVPVARNTSCGKPSSRDG